MTPRFVTKRFAQRPSGAIKTSEVSMLIENPESKQEKKNKNVKNSSDMNTKEQFEMADAVLNSIAPEVKVVKKDRGLIERTESSKIILTEDNRQVLND